MAPNRYLEKDVHKAFENALTTDYIQLWRKYPLLFDLGRMTKANKASIFNKNRKLYNEMGFTLDDLPNADIFNVVMFGRPEANVVAHARGILTSSEMNKLASKRPGTFLAGSFPISKINKLYSITALMKHVARNAKYKYLTDAIVSRYDHLSPAEYKLYLLSDMKVLNTKPIEDICSNVLPRTLILELGGLRSLYENEYYASVTLARFDEIVEEYFADVVAGRSKLIPTAKNSIARFRTAYHQYKEDGNVIVPPEYEKSVIESKRRANFGGTRWDYSASRRII